MVLSASPAASQRLSGDQASARTAGLLFRIRTSAPVVASHRRIVSPESPEASHFPFGDQAIASSLSLWPAIFMISAPFAALQTRSVLSTPAEAMNFPLGENTSA